MGQTLSGESDGGEVEVQRYHFLEALRDDVYGEVNIMEDRKSQFNVAVKEQVFQGTEDLEAELTNLRGKRERTHNNILNILEFTVQNEDRLCSSVKRLSLCLEYVKLNFGTEIRLRRQNQVDFNEQEISNVLFSVVCALAYLQERGVYHGDLKSTSILLTKEFNVKIADPSVIKTMNAFASIMTTGLQRGVYLSPALVKAIKEKNWSPVHNKFKSDVFTLGMIMLEAIMLKFCDEIYDYEKGRLRLDILDNFFSMSKKKYSERFCHVIQRMINTEEVNRPDFIELSNELRLNFHQGISYAQTGLPQNLLQPTKFDIHRSESQLVLDTDTATGSSQHSRQHQPTAQQVFADITNTGNQQEKVVNHKQGEKEDEKPRGHQQENDPRNDARTRNSSTNNSHQQNIPPVKQSQIQPQQQHRQSSSERPPVHHNSNNNSNSRGGVMNEQTNQHKVSQVLNSRAPQAVDSNNTRNMTQTTHLRSNGINIHLTENTPKENETHHSTANEVNRQIVIPPRDIGSTSSNTKENSEKAAKHQLPLNVSQYNELSANKKNSSQKVQNPVITNSNQRANSYQDVSKFTVPVDNRENRSKGSEVNTHDFQTIPSATNGDRKNFNFPSTFENQNLPHVQTTPNNLAYRAHNEGEHTHNVVERPSSGTQMQTTPQAPYQTTPYNQIRTENSNAQEVEQLKRLYLADQPRIPTSPQNNVSIDTISHRKIAEQPTSSYNQNSYVPHSTQNTDIINQLTKTDSNFYPIEKKEFTAVPVENNRSFNSFQVPTQSVRETARSNNSEYQIPDYVQRILDEVKNKQLGSGAPTSTVPETKPVSYSTTMTGLTPFTTELLEKNKLYQPYSNTTTLDKFVNSSNHTTSLDPYKLSQLPPVQYDNQPIKGLNTQPMVPTTSYQPDLTVQQLHKEYKFNSSNNYGSQLNQKVEPVVDQHPSTQYDFSDLHRLQSPTLQSNNEPDSYQHYNNQYLNHHPEHQQQHQMPQQSTNDFYEDVEPVEAPVYEQIQETYEDGSVYDGEKVNGLRHGIGKFFYADGGYYEGDWRYGRMEGLGTLYYPSDGLAYVGQWKDDKFNGKGTVFNEQPLPIQGYFDYTCFDNLGEQWVKYEGDFIDDNKEGMGTLYLSNGDKFSGCFVNDLVNGRGTYFRAQDGKVVSGEWYQNKLISNS